MIKYLKNFIWRENYMKSMYIGTALMTTVPLMYIFIDQVYQVYLAEVLYGIGSGLAYPTWVGLWSLNLKPGEESFEWSVYSTFTGLGAAITAAVGSAIASLMGFTTTFALTGIMCIFGCANLFFLEQERAASGKRRWLAGQA